LRHAVVPDDGSVFCSADFSGIQARVVLALAGQTDKVALMASGHDVYIDMAEQIFSRPIDKDKDPEERQAGKNTVLGCGFGMGKNRFHQKYCSHHPLAFAEQCINAYRYRWAPKVPITWYALSEMARCALGFKRRSRGHDDLAEAIERLESWGIRYRREDKWLTVSLPSGRKLWYWNPQLKQTQTPWDPDRFDWSMTFDALKMGRVREVRCHGGLLTENIVMGIEVDIQRRAWYNCERAGIPIVHETYDELLAEVREDKLDLGLFKKCMLDMPEWVHRVGIPVAIGEPWVGKRYKK
jgi:hypothetical protein